jgi:hypothetical protein
MQRLRTALAVLGGATVLVLAANTLAVAATGQGFVLGKSNSANNITALTRTTSGSVLKLQSASSASSPLTVNGTGKVANLNADTVDGYDSSVLLNKAYVYEDDVVANGTTGFSRSTPDFPAGAYLVSATGWLYGPTTGVPASIICYLKMGDPLVEQYLPIQSNGFYTINLTGVVSKASAGGISIVCTGPTGNYSTFTGDPLQLTVTKIGSRVTGSFITGRTHVPRPAANALR